MPEERPPKLFNVCHVLPLLLEYSYVPYPPVGAKIVIEPFVFPKQPKTFAGVTIALIITGCEITVPDEASKSITHDGSAASRIEIWYVPATKPVKLGTFCHVFPLLLEYSYVPEPPASALITI